MNGEDVNVVPEVGRHCSNVHRPLHDLHNLYALYAEQEKVEDRWATRLQQGLEGVKVVNIAPLQRVTAIPTSCTRCDVEPAHEQRRQKS
jgi:hypothetical protein